MPGFVDCHTHVVFGGSRVDEYVARCAGLEPPPSAPTGIVGTMAATRPLDARALAAASAGRLREMLAHGTTTVESKTGYGLARDSELAMLEANAPAATRGGDRRRLDLSRRPRAAARHGPRGLRPGGRRNHPGHRRPRARIVLRRVLRRRVLHARREPSDPRGGARPRAPAKAPPGRLFPHRRRASGGRARRDHGRPSQPHQRLRARGAGRRRSGRRRDAAARLRRPEPDRQPTPARWSTRAFGSRLPPTSARGVTARACSW